MLSFSPQKIVSAFFTSNYDNFYQVGSTGKSGSLFFFTPDRKYMVKTLPEREFESFREILKGYFEYLE
jgi:1-phosphatidylinositol-4-phosphate 5-kinase